MGLTDSMRDAQMRSRDFNAERLVEECGAVLRQPATSIYLTDEEREELIRHHAKEMNDAPFHTDKRAGHWNRMRDLINGRSDAQVEAMEKARGLR